VSAAAVPLRRKPAPTPTLAPRLSPEEKQQRAVVPTSFYTVTPNEFYDVLLRKVPGGNTERVVALVHRKTTGGKDRPMWVKITAQAAAEYLIASKETIEEAFRDAEKLGLIESRRDGKTNCYRLTDWRTWKELPDRVMPVDRMPMDHAEELDSSERPAPARIVVEPGRKSEPFQLTPDLRARIENRCASAIALEATPGEDGTLDLAFTSETIGGVKPAYPEAVQFPPASASTDRRGKTRLSGKTLQSNEELTNLRHALTPDERLDRELENSGRNQRNLLGDLLERSFRTLGRIPAEVLDQAVERRNGSSNPEIARRLRGQRATSWSEVLELICRRDPGIDPRRDEIRHALNGHFAESIGVPVPERILDAAVLALGEGSVEAALEWTAKRLGDYIRRGERVSWGLVPGFFGDRAKTPAKPVEPEERRIARDGRRREDQVDVLVQALNLPDDPIAREVLAGADPDLLAEARKRVS
jgi:hypothetical protein